MTESQIITGDCLEVMPTIPANSIDAVVTDPPYGLSFMGKAWDHGVPGVPFWEAALRVMKPGAYLLAFGGTRTFHRLTCAIEDAGFQVRDCLMWLYGSGFPKSLDVSKAIDKAAGAKRVDLGTNPNKLGRTRDMRAGHFVGNGVADMESICRLTAPATHAAKQWSGWGTALKPAWEPIILARKPLEGTVAENVQKWGTGAINIDGGRIPHSDDLSRGNGGTDVLSWGGTYGAGMNTAAKRKAEGLPPQGRWPANVLLDEEAGRALDGQTGVLQSSYVTKGSKGKLFGMPGHATEKKDDGLTGASRFFYCAKASKSQRGEGNNHPTVKPLALLEYLIRLVTPPNGLVLDPFCGSGSTGVAANRLGFGFLGIEKEPAYVGIAQARIAPVRVAV
jgi:predicted RNA methylase